MKGIIKEYLESQARLDPCFNEKYKAELIDRCIKYIWKLAKEKANNSEGKDCIAIKDEEVFKWSRDYFNDEIWKKEDEEKAKQKAKEEENFPPWNDEDDKNLDERIAESRQKAEEYRIKKETEERDTSSKTFRMKCSTTFQKTWIPTPTKTVRFPGILTKKKPQLKNFSSNNKGA